MGHNAIFKLIDMESWLRKPYFEHYLQQVKCTYSLTVPVDISALLGACQKHTVKLYPAMIYIITTAVNQIEELRIDYDEQSQLGMWSYRLPSYTVFHSDDKIFSTLWTPYTASFKVFYQNYLEDIKRYGKVKSLLAKGEEPANTFPISCIPWVDFTSFNLNIYNNGHYLAPIFTLGQYADNNRVMPIAAQLHHAVCDGYHAGLLFDQIKKMLETSETWMVQ